MKNKLADLNDHLFAAIERLGDETTKGEELAAEIQRAEAIAKISTQIVGNAALALRAQVLMESGEIRSTPKQIGSGE